MPQENQSPDQLTERGAPRSPRTKHRPSMLGYLAILFTAAFLLLLLSYFMQQRRNDQNVIDGLQENMSAMQMTNTLLDQNQQLLEEREALQAQVASLQEQISTLQSQVESLSQEQILLNAAMAEQRVEKNNLEKTAQALDWLWRIEREYFQGRAKNARSLIQEFEGTGLKDFLPDQPLVDPEYRTPAFQYQAIYDVLF